MKNRATRRHHTQRMKAKARHIVKNIWKENNNCMDKNYNHLAKCSCWMCGNPRKYNNEKTRQELEVEQFDE